MIGYIKIYKPELKMKDFQLYNAYYCGICKALGHNYGLIFRNLLNYDAVFVAIALDSINDSIIDYEKFRCVLHPVKKKLRCINNNMINYLADVTVYMTYKKLLDDINDDNSLSAKIGAAAFKKAYNMSCIKIGELAHYINSVLKELTALEKINSDSIDETADCYGKIYSKIFTEKISKDSVKYKAVEWLGYNLGRWIYITDAYDDIESDLKKRRYNPILCRFPMDKEMLIEDYKSSILERMSFIMYSTLNEAAKSYDLIDKSVNSGIINNILYEGLYSVTEKILNGDSLNAAEKPL